eukprot:g1320.t1
MAGCRKQTKGQWARDNPTFNMVIMVAFGIASIAYTAALGDGSLGAYFKALLYGQILFVGSGAVIASACYALGNRFLRTAHSSAYDKIEWLFALDVHFNACVPLYLILCMGQFFMLPLLLQEGYFSAMIANMLYGSATVVYWYLTFTGYKHLPCLQHTDAFLYPAMPFLAFLLFATLLGINSTRAVLGVFYYV